MGSPLKTIQGLHALILDRLSLKSPPQYFPCQSWNQRVVLFHVVFDFWEISERAAEASGKRHALSHSAMSDTLLKQSNNETLQPDEINT